MDLLLNFCYSFGNTVLVCLVLYLLTLALIWSSTQSNLVLVRKFSAKHQIKFGALGIVIHEFAHILVALLFWHEILDYKLLDWNVLDKSVTLGFVKDRWNNAKYFQRLGNFFEGIAPILFTSWIMLLVFMLFTPELINNINAWLTVFIYSSHNGLALSKLNFSFWKFLVIDFFAIQLGLGGCTLSKADIEASKLGLKEALILVFVCFFSFEVVGWHTFGLFVLLQISKYLILPIFLMLVLMSLNLCFIKVLSFFRQG